MALVQLYREALWELSVLPKNTMPWLLPGLGPGLLELESNTLTSRPMQVQHAYAPGTGLKTPEVFVICPCFVENPDGTSDLVKFDLISRKICWCLYILNWEQESRQSRSGESRVDRRESEDRGQNPSSAFVSMTMGRCCLKTECRRETNLCRCLN